MQIIGINQQIALSKVQQSLREGDFVFVKTLKDLGGGKYTVSFAGGRFNVMSERSLAPGQAFRAQISFSAGKILLTPAAAPAEGMTAGGDLSSLLAAMGLPADGVSERILRFLTQSGAKLDPALMQKARRLAQKFKGRETAAAEASLALEEKGIDSDSDALDKLMDLLDGEPDGQSAPRQEREDFLLELNDAARQDDSAREPGAKKDWAFFPYEFLDGGGVIRTLSDREKGSVEKMVVNYKSSSGNIFFAVYFGMNGAAKAIQVSASPKPLEDLARGGLEKLAAAFGPGVKVQTVPEEKFSAFGILDLPLAGVEAFA